MSKVEPIVRPREVPPPPVPTPTEKLVARSKAVRELAGAQSYLTDAGAELDYAGDEDFRNRAEVLAESVETLLTDMAGAS